jgi:hypothetical protein
MDFMKKRIPPKLRKLSSAKQRRLDELLDKNSERAITADEKTELESLVAQAEQVMVGNAKLLAAFADGDRAERPARAVPVTIWVKPEPVGR